METYLASVLDGEISSFEPVVNEHQREVWGIIGVLLLDKPQATALAKDIFLAVYAHLNQYDAQYPFKAFVRTIARQKVREYLQQQSARGQPLPVFHAYVNKVFADDAAAVAHLLKASQLLEKFAAELPAFVTQLLHRRYDLCENYEQIAKATQRPVAAVRQTLRRAQTDLADRLIHHQRTDPTGQRTIGEELTLKLLDHSISEPERADLERLLLSQTDEVPRHIALMEVEAWMRGRWRDAKLGRSVINAIGQSLRDKRVQHAADAKQPHDSPTSELAQIAADAADAVPRRRRRRRGSPLGLIALLLATMALAGVGWIYYTKQLGKLAIPVTSVQVVSFDGGTSVETGGKSWQPITNLVLPTPAAATSQKAGTLTLQYNPKLRLTLGSETRATFETNTSVARLVKLERGSLTLDRQADAPGPAPMIIAGSAEVVPAAQSTQLAIQQIDDSYRVDVQNGGATVTNRATGENVQLRSGQFALVTAGLALQARSAATTHRVTDGLISLYRFAEGRGDTVHDVSNVGQPLDLVLNDESTVKWGRMSMTVQQPAMIRSRGPATKLIDAIKQSGELTLEAWVEPARADQQAPIVALASEPKYRNFTLFQGDGEGGRGDQFSFNLRTRDSDGGGRPAVRSGEKTAAAALTQVVVVHEKSGATRWYLNGRPADTSQQGELANWAGDHPLVLANEPIGDHPWLGAYRLLAIYDRALTEKDIAVNYEVALTEPLATEPAASPAPVEPAASAPAKTVRTGYQEVFYLAGSGPTRTTDFIVNSDDYRIRIKLTLPADREQEVTLRQLDRNSDRGEQLLRTSKSGFQTIAGTMGKGTYSLLLNCNTDVQWVVSVEELRELDRGQAATPERDEFKQ